MPSSLITTKVLNAVLAVAKASDYTVERDNEAGIAVVKDHDGQVCLRALQKGRNQPWITTFYNTSQVHWDWPEEGKPCPSPAT